MILSPLCLIILIMFEAYPPVHRDAPQRLFTRLMDDHLPYIDRRTLDEAFDILRGKEGGMIYISYNYGIYEVTYVGRRELESDARVQVIRWVMAKKP